jgi:hypothetical protein
VPRQVARLVTQIVAGSSSTSSPTPRVWVPRPVARLIACCRLLHPHRATECLGTSRGSSRGSSRRSSSTTSPPLRVREPWQIARLVTWIVAQLVVDYFAYGARLGASAHRTAHRLSLTTSPTLRDRVPRHVARLITWLVAPLVVDYSASRRLVVDYFAFAAHPGASARHAARCAARRRLLHFAQARRRLLRLAQACRRLLRFAQARH